jgi:hypothetical protein
LPCGQGPQSSPADPDRRARLGPVALGLATALLLGAAFVLAYSVVGTASARITGATDNPGSLLEAALIELDTGAGGGDDPGARAEVLVDADGLYPGLLVERCVQLRYHGSLDSVDLVLWAGLGAGTGLEDHLTTSVAVGEGTDPGCTDFRPGATRFDGALSGLASAHPRYEEGLVLAPATSGVPVTARFRLQVDDTNEAQHLTTEARFTFEVRP